MKIFWSDRPRLALVLILVTLVGMAHHASAAVILVTSQWQKIGSSPGCSLQEAIYASTFHSNLAIDKVNPDGTDHLVITDCIPGNGNDVIVLPSGAFFPMYAIVDDAHNPFGPTATPIITTNITIQGNGSQLFWTRGPNDKIRARAFAVGSTGSLTLQDLYIRGFTVKGGDGTDGGGGGMGAGGAIYVKDGRLTIENSTFDGNRALGGNAGDVALIVSGNGGGGGLSGNGGDCPFPDLGGPGGGGARGNGSGCDGRQSAGGGGGGGTVTNGSPGVSMPDGTERGGPGGIACGGKGADPSENRGSDAPCPGGGGGGGSGARGDPGNGGDGGNGNYGGGGGGGAGFAPLSDAIGGNGGFGGGGGCGQGGDGGNGGFGGGGGYSSRGNPGKGGVFGGDGSVYGGGGGAALGGAIFNDGGSLTIRNSTFTGNSVYRGNGVPPLSPGVPGGKNGADAGGAIFSRNGSVTILNSTISFNLSTGSGAGVVVYEDGSPTALRLNNTIISNNSANECYVKGNVTKNGVANLIMSNGFGSFDACPGFVSHRDPQLGPLQVNEGGTPTMAIPRTSPAYNIADAGTSLPRDQRGVPRPQPRIGGGGFDIGAFELCVSLFESCIPALIGQTALLTVQVSPPGAGTTTPPIGTTSQLLGSVVAIMATPNPGFTFGNWTGDLVTDPTQAQTTIIMDAPHTVIANFVPGTCVSNLVGAGTSGTALAPPRVDLTWDAVRNANRYVVLRANTSGGPYNLVGSSLDNVFSDTTDGLINGNTYFYVVQPFDTSGGQLCQSNEVAIRVPAPRS